MNCYKSEPKLRIDFSLVGQALYILLKQIILIVDIAQIDLITGTNTGMMIKLLLLLPIKAQGHIMLKPDSKKPQPLNIIQMANSYVTNLFGRFILNYKTIGLGLLLQGQTLEFLEDLGLFLGGLGAGLVLLDVQFLGKVLDLQLVCEAEQHFQVAHQLLLLQVLFALVCLRFYCVHQISEELILLKQHLP